VGACETCCVALYNRRSNIIYRCRRMYTLTKVRARWVANPAFRTKGDDLEATATSILSGRALSPLPHVGKWRLTSLGDTCEPRQLQKKQGASILGRP